MPVSLTEKNVILMNKWISGHKKEQVPVSLTEKNVILMNKWISGHKKEQVERNKIKKKGTN